MSAYVCNIRGEWSSGDYQFVDVATGSAVFTVKTTGVLLADGENLELGTTTGSKIGTAASQKLGFYGATPVIQRAKASYNNWAAHTDIVAALVALGLFDAA